jgi:hypothetical protein
MWIPECALGIRGTNDHGTQRISVAKSLFFVAQNVQYPTVDMAQAMEDQSGVFDAHLAPPSIADCTA